MERKHGGIIINQLHKLGCSCDWDRERFTMDEEYTKAVGQVFIELFRKDSSTGAAAWSTGALYPSRPSLMKKSS